MVGGELAQLRAEGVVELGEAVEEEDEWPAAGVGIVQIDSVDGGGRVVEVGTSPCIGVFIPVPSIQGSSRGTIGAPLAASL